MASSGLFDDVLPATAPATPAPVAPRTPPRPGTSGLFNDVLPGLGQTAAALAGPAPAPYRPQLDGAALPVDAAGAPAYGEVFKPEVGLGEGIGRGYAAAGERFGGLANFLGLAPARAIDAVHGLVSGRPETGAVDTVGGWASDAFHRADALGLDPNRERFNAGTGAASGLAGAVPDIAAAVLTGGESAPLQAGVRQSLGREIATELGQTALHAGRASVVPGAGRATDVGRQVLEHGGSAPQAFTAAADAGLATGVTNVLPLSASGNLLVRAAQGVPANIGADWLQTTIENSALPADMRQAYDGTQTATSGGTGALMAALLGERGHEPLRIPERAPARAPAPNAPPPADLGAMLGQILAAGEHPAPSTPAPAETASSVAAGPGPATPPPPGAGAVPVAKPEAAAPTRLEARGREVEPRTPAGTPVKARYAVVDANGLTASHDVTGAPNPNFPQALQPRDRERKASQAQIQAIAGKLDPTLLGEAPTTADGAPLVAPDGVVESGNGRTLALRAAYASGRADHYREWLKANAPTFGLDPAQVDAHPAPMLVRVRQGAATPAERIAIARESNESTVARMGAAERAQSDAAALTDEDLASYRPNEDGSVLGAGNQDFLNRFARRLPASERGDLLTADGRWSAEMARRVQAAVFAKAYRSPDVINLHAEEASPEVRNILTALNRAAPAFAALGDEGAPVREAVVEAVRKVRDARRSGQALEEALRQSDLLGGDTPAADRIAGVFGANARSAARLTDFLEELAGVSAANQDNGSGALFGDAAPKGDTLGGAIDAASRKVAEPGSDYGDMRAHARAVRQQLGLFGHQPQPAAKPARAPAPASGDLFGGPSSQEHLDALERQRDAQRNGLGRDAVPASQGAGELFAGPRPDQADLTSPADPFDHEAGPRRVRNATIDTWRPGAAPVHTGVDALRALAPLRRQAQEVLAALVLDKADRPLAVVRLNRGTATESVVDFPSLYGAIADVPGAAKVWLAHNHPSGRPEASAADERVTQQAGHVLRDTGIELAGHVVLGTPGRGAVMTPNERTTRPTSASNVDHPGAARATGPGVPVLERQLTGNRLPQDAPKVSSPATGLERMREANPGNRTGVLMLDAQGRVLGFLPVEGGETLRTGDARTGFARLMRAAHQQNAHALLVADPHATVNGASAAGENLARAARAAELTVHDVVNPVSGVSLASQGAMPRGNPLGFQSAGDGGGAVPAQLRAELERSLGHGTVDTLVRSGLLEIRPGDGSEVQALWDGQRVTAFEGNVPAGHALGVLLHETSHARLEEILGADGWAKAQADYEKLLRQGDATARAAEARVERAGVSPEDRAQERLAYLTEEAAKRHPSPAALGLIQRILSSFRRWAATSPVFRALARVGIQAPTLKPVDFVAFAHQGVRELTAMGERRIARDRVVADLKAERQANAANFGLNFPKPLAADHPLLRETHTLPGREGLRAQIVDGHFEGKQPAPADRKPIAWVMGGGGASGKGTLLAQLEARGEVGADAVHVDPDAIKAQIPEYGQLLERGDSRAAAVTHEESSNLAGEVRQRAIDGRYDLVLDRTLGNPDKARRELEQLKAAGYEVRLYGMTVDPKTAIERAVSRAEKRGRYVPLEALLQAHKGFASGFEDYARLADEAHLYDNSGEAPVEIAHTQGGGLAIVDGQAYDSFRNRSQLNDHATTYAELHPDHPERVGAGAPGARGEGAGARAGGAREGEGAPQVRASVRAEDVATRTRTGELPLPPGPPAAQPQEMAKRWTERVREAFERRWEPLGKLPERDLYLDLRGLAQGRIAKAEELGAAIAAKLSNIPAEHRREVYDYLTTAGADPRGVSDVGVRMAAQDAKHLIGTIGDALVARGLIPPEAREKYRDAYLPRLYFAHLLKGDAFRSFGSGKGLSDQGYTKARNDEIPEEVRKVVLGEIQDPAFLAAVAVAKPARDLALVDWLSQVAGTHAWTLPEATVDWNGKRVTPYWLKDRADQLRGQARLYQDAESASKARDLAEELDNLADQALSAIGAVPDTVRADFKQVPDSPRYGPLRGLWTRKEIYEDVVGLGRLVPEDRNWAERALGFGGWMTKATQGWKFLKVAANPPSQIRNAVSNAIMLQLSGVPMHRIPGLLARAVGEIRHNGAAYQAAKEHGLTASTFASEELLKLHTNLLDLAKREGELGVMGQVHLGARRIVNGLGHVYQATETVYKVAKLLDAMERQKMSPAAAAREANKWLFDYSLVPQSVRYLRNAPVGAPFVTYAYKVLPRLLEVGLQHPARFAPYVALYYGWQYALAALLDQAPEEIAKLEQALPEWMQDRSGVLMLPWKDGAGRWTFLDTGYYLPWTMWWDSARHLARGDVNKAREDMGLISGPAVDVLVALTTGQDNFTKEPIANPDDPPGKQWRDRVAWAWGLVAPPMLDARHGALGRTLEAMSGDVKPDGSPKTTGLQAALRYVGVNIYPTDLEAARDANVRHLAADVQATVQRARRELIRAQPAERAHLAEQYRGEIDKRAEKLRQYQEQTEIPEGLR